MRQVSEMPLITDKSSYNTWIGLVPDPKPVPDPEDQLGASLVCRGVVLYCSVQYVLLLC